MASPVVYHCEDYLAAIRRESEPVKQAVITANKNNYDLDENVIDEIKSDAARDITGIVAPAAALVKVLHNVGASTITLKHASASSAAANRFICPGAADFSLTAGAFVPLFYDTGDALWVPGLVFDRSGVKLSLTETTVGVLVLLNRHYWNMRHSGYKTDGSTANTGRLYYRYGLTKPTASYAATSAALRASLAIPDGETETIQVKSAIAGLFLLAATADLMVFLRPNESGLGLNR